MLMMLRRAQLCMQSWAMRCSKLLVRQQSCTPCLQTCMYCAIFMQLHASREHIG